MADNPLPNQCPLPKVADFGMSKKFYEDLTYEKTSRVYVPWKWMAIEYLKEDYFTLKSDVWSYGVLLWEIFSFGRNPYGQQEYDEVLAKLDKGDRLTYPGNLENISSWEPESFYNNLTEECFKTDPDKRASFDDVVKLIEERFENEKESYIEMEECYQETLGDNYLKLG